MIGNAQAAGTCPVPMVQLTTDTKAKVQGSLETLLKLGKVKGSGDVDTVTQDVMHEYPSADQLALRQNTLSILCNLVLSSPYYSHEFKESVVTRLLDNITDSRQQKPPQTIRETLKGKQMTVNYKNNPDPKDAALTIPADAHLLWYWNEYDDGPACDAHVAPVVAQPPDKSGIITLTSHGVANSCDPHNSGVAWHIEAEIERPQP